MNNVTPNRHMIHRITRRSKSHFTAAALSLALVTGCDYNNSQDDDRSRIVPPQPGAQIIGEKYNAQVRWTELGIPHIDAKDWGSLGYGMGYAFAEDNACVFMKDIITVRGERSKFFGRNGEPFFIRANGASAANVDSDFFWKHTATDAAIDNILSNQNPKLLAAIQGYADGVTRYNRELKAGEHPGRHPECTNEEWLQDVSLEDMGRRIYRLSVLASSSVFMQEIGSIQPPPLPPTDNNQASATALSSDELLQLAQTNERFQKFPFTRELPFGSNMYSLAGETTQTGENLQFVNPHFPWFGTERLHLSHLRMDGEDQVDIMGVSLHGAPAILIGFNRNLAWSHTVSTAYRFTIYELTLNPTNPTQYIYDGELRDMIADTYTVEITEDDGSTTTEQRTLYKSHYGPIMNLFVQGDIGPFNWTNLNAYAIRDANAENTRLLENFFQWNQAESLAEFEQIQNTVVGVPWVNTTATAPGEQAYYSDVTVVPNVPDEMVSPLTCSRSPVAVALAELAPGLPLLDGNRSECEWRTDPDSAADGVFGASNLPSLRRDDWVHNCNNSYWLTNPAEPITGFAAIIGDEDTERTLRTRKCIRHIQQRLDGTDGREGVKFTRENLKEIVLSSEIHSAELARDQLIDAYCTTLPLTTLLNSSAQPVDITAACGVLRDWDLTTELDSVGGHIWREFWANALSTTGGPWQNGYSSADPVGTPNTLRTLNPEMSVAFADAITTLQDSGIALNAVLGDIQWAERNNVKIPIFGDVGSVGAFTIAIAPRRDDGEGYGPVDYGNSYVQVVGWDADGNPEADAFITYSQSTDSASDHFGDYTERYSRKEWKRLPFTEAQIEADKIREISLIE